VRGQRLFIRPIDPSDRDAVLTFLQRYSADMPLPDTGLLGKLVGDLAAVLAVTILPSSLRIDAIVVRDDLRRKQVGRFMVDEAGRLAVKMDRDTLRVEGSGGAEEFLRRVGFERDVERDLERGGEQQWIRRVR
jgi:GNAT superfamily N-acetyltransferase